MYFKLTDKVVIFINVIKEKVNKKSLVYYYKTETLL